jgi:hypothetical protein
MPTVLTQLVQRVIQTRVLSRILAGDQPVGTPRVLRLLDRHPVLQGVPARLIGIGVLPEHAPRAVSAGPRPAVGGKGAAGSPTERSDRPDDAGAT